MGQSESVPEAVESMEEQEKTSSHNEQSPPRAQLQGQGSEDNQQNESDSEREEEKGREIGLSHGRHRETPGHCDNPQPQTPATSEPDTSKSGVRASYQFNRHFDSTLIYMYPPPFR